MTLSHEPTQQEIQALDAWVLRLLAWLMGVITRLGLDRRRSRLKRGSRLLHRLIRLCEHNTEAVVFELADALAPPLELRTYRPRSAPPGFRVKRIRGCRYFSHARVRLAAERGVAARVERLLDVLANPERCVARALRLIVVGRKYSRLVPAAPPADPIAASIVAAPCVNDSS